MIVQNEKSKVQNGAWLDDSCFQFFMTEAGKTVRINSFRPSSFAKASEDRSAKFPREAFLFILLAQREHQYM
jgi:hypothetical protein